jgi:hypothetical protein
MIDQMTSPLHCTYDKSGSRVQQQPNVPLASPQIVDFTGIQIVSTGAIVTSSER